MAQLKDKAKAIKKCREMGRKVIWSNDKGIWHCATNRANTPHYAVETMDIEAETEA